MELCEPGDEGQTDPCARRVRRPLPPLNEGLEDAVTRFRRDPRSVVFDLEQDAFAGQRGAHGDARSGRGVTGLVRQKIFEDAFELRWVDVDLDGIGRDKDGSVSDVGMIDDALNEQPDVGELAAGSHDPSLEPVDVEETAEQAL